MSDQFSLFSQLSVIKDRFWQSLKEGATCYCPICGRFSHFNRFCINRQMLNDMVELLRLQNMHQDDEGYVHHTEFLKRKSRDFYNLKRWELIEAKPNNGEKDQPTSGYWRITEKGVEFLRGTILLPKYAFVFDDMVRGWSDDQINVHDAWGKNFSYHEILEGNCDILEEKDC